MKTAIACIRVSTHKQGKSGLGLEAQQALIERFADQEGLQIVQSFTEVQSGKDDDQKRPQLSAALEAARKAKAPVIVAKLDRLFAGFLPGSNVTLTTRLLLPSTCQRRLELQRLHQ
jgi:DNA invertase Pin-like site-specific DNA recombinase